MGVDREACVANGAVSNCCCSNCCQHVLGGSEVIKEDLEVPNQQHKRAHTSHTAVYGFVAVASLYRAALSARCSALLHTL